MSASYPSESEYSIHYIAIAAVFTDCLVGIYTFSIPAFAAFQVP